MEQQLKQRNHEKTLLNNLCTSRGLELPLYNTWRTGGTDHAPEFCSCVTLSNGEGYEGLTNGHTRKEAEAIAAARAISALQKAKKTLLLIDTKSMRDFFDRLSERDLSKMTVLLFCRTQDQLGVTEDLRVINTHNVPITLLAYLGFFMGQATYDRYLVASHSNLLTAWLVPSLSAGSNPTAMPWLSNEILLVADIEKLHSILYM
jgi:hypothetical protein